MKQPTTTLYVIPREENYGTWARIWITDDGCLTTISDHGNYGYWWGRPNCEFRQFLCNCDDHYLIGKLAEGRREWDEAGTRKAIACEIKRLHGEGEDTREEAELLAAAELDTEVGFVRWLDDPGERGERMGRLIDTVTGAGLSCFQPPLQLQMFIKHIWPRFIAMLKAELEAEKSPFDGYSSVEDWVWHVTDAPCDAPGCHVAGGGAPPRRSSFDGRDGFWVPSRAPGFYAWVPDEIAARDASGMYHAGQDSPGAAAGQL